MLDVGNLIEEEDNLLGLVVVVDRNPVGVVDHILAVVELEKHFKG